MKLLLLLMFALFGCTICVSAQVKKSTSRGVGKSSANSVRNRKFHKQYKLSKNQKCYFTNSKGRKIYVMKDFCKTNAVLRDEVENKASAQKVLPGTREIEGEEQQNTEQVPPPQTPIRRKANPPKSPNNK